MSKNRKLVRVIQNFYQQFQRKSPSTVKEQSLWLLRSFIVTKKRPEWINAGFVLPTVAMVSLVVVLLTIAILFRSFERSKNASNVRVNQAVLNAATPAIDRAKAKIDQLFADPTLPRSTPSDGALYTALNKNLAKYTFGDEKPLEVRYDIDGNGNIKDNADQLENKEISRSAWRFPVDTDNNGKYDSFTVYGIFFRTPGRGDNSNNFDRARTPLDSRTPPMSDGDLGELCAAKGTSASLIGDSGWYESGGVIKKSFFVYSATVPITDEKAEREYGRDFEQYKGNRGFSAVEYQQDKERIPFVNNAVIYSDDLEITPGSGLNLNGRIATNSNLLTGRTFDPIRLYQVSSPSSCFYKARNSKIIVGGNVGYGRVTETRLNGGTEVHLFKPGGVGGKKLIDSKTRNANNKAGEIAYNSQAYAQRIDQLVNLQTGTNPANYSKDPTEVKEAITSQLADNPGLDVVKLRRKLLERYFKNRTRQVPFKEVEFGENPGTAKLQDRGKETLRAQDRWIYPFDPKRNSTSYTGLKLYLSRLNATEPSMLKEVNKEEEKYLGDRVIVGNNLPAKWYDKESQDFLGEKAPQDVLPKSKDTEWTEWNDEDKRYRYRNTQIKEIISLDGETKRDQKFEVEATKKPKNPLDNVGGMRVVTGAGIYVDDITYPRNAVSFLPEPKWDENFVDPTNRARDRVKVRDLKFNSQDPIIVWPDSMPMTGGDGETRQGDLVMRATAVYHYAQSDGINQTPIACVSSYYDPTNSITAQNKNRLPEAPDAIGANSRTSLGKSNNGIVYRAPYSSHSARRSAMSRLSTQLERQARLVFPNGRFVNEPLRVALEKRRKGKTLSMADNSAVDTAVCAIKIENGTLTRSTTYIPNGAIYETSFLDARQVKAIEQNPNSSTEDPNYSLDIEQRQPLEVRVTALDLDKLRRKKISGGLRQEYLIPNSGIIYATRDDALEDLSFFSDNIEQRKLLSPTDYKLDSTRRPNGIMLINGARIDREEKHRDEEKGLILATNLPAYIKGDLNLHAKGGNKNRPVEEFTQQLRDRETGKINWSQFYTRKTQDPNFACRKGDKRLPKCTTGDSWRPATILADAVTVLSENYRFGFRDEGDYDLRNNAGNAEFDENLEETNASEIRKKLGFFNNNYLTSADWYTNQGYPKDFDTSSPKSGQPRIQGSSYVNNFVTPIQRRVEFGEYVMEMCPKLPVETCTPDDWIVQLPTKVKKEDIPAKKASQIPIGTEVDDLDSGTTAQLATDEEDGRYRRYARRVAFLRDPNTNKLILDEDGAPVPIGINRSGEVQYYPYQELKLPFDKKTKVFSPPKTDDDSKSKSSSSTPATSPTEIETVTFEEFDDRNRPRERDNALWFRTADDRNFSNRATEQDNYGKEQPLFFQEQLTVDEKFKAPKKGDFTPALKEDFEYKQGGEEQPLLVPVLQIHMPNDRWTKTSGNPGDSRTKLPDHKDRGIATDRTWLPEAGSTTTNVAIVAGDTPGRSTESNGGLENFVRYLETWKDINHNLSGSLIQYQRSAYATAPWQVIQKNGKNAKNGSLYGFRPYYRTNVTGGPNRGEGMSPFYTPPKRQWGFDVALLSQIPDLFAQQFTVPAAGQPNEFFREVSRDDDWVKTLLCARTLRIRNNRVSLDGNKKAVPESQRPNDFCEKYAGG